MAKALFSSMPSRKAAIDEKAKVARLRELRLANDAARREAGTWGELSVREIAHGSTGEVFVFVSRGRDQLDLVKLSRMRAPDLSIAEQTRLKEWLADRAPSDLVQTQIAWNVSRAEAARIREARIAEHESACRSVVDDAEAGRRAQPKPP
jgi:hypothetical protein